MATAYASAVHASVAVPVAPRTVSEDDPELGTLCDTPYNVFLWNDPVTLMEVVVRTLEKVFGYEVDTAERLMLTAHREGKAVVWTGERDRATRYCLELGSHGLQSTVAKAA